MSAARPSRGATTTLTAHLTHRPARRSAYSIGSLEMYLMHEQLSRIRTLELQQQAEHASLVRRLAAARRWERKSEEAARRARRLRSSIG